MTAPPLPPRPGDPDRRRLLRRARLRDAILLGAGEDHAGPPPPDLVRRGVWIAAAVAFVLGAGFGSLTAYGFMGGTRALPIGALNGAVTAALAAGLWRLMAVGLRFRGMMGAFAFMIAAVGGVMLTTALVSAVPGDGSMPRLDQVLELAAFIGAFAVQRVGFLVFPAFGLAGYLVTRWCETRRIAALA